MNANVSVKTIFLEKKLLKYLPCNSGFEGCIFLSVDALRWSCMDDCDIDGWYLEPGSQAVASSGMVENGDDVDSRGSEVLWWSLSVLWGGSKGREAVVCSGDAASWGDTEGWMGIEGWGYAKEAVRCWSFVNGQDCPCGSLRCWIEQNKKN